MQFASASQKGPCALPDCRSLRDSPELMSTVEISWGNSGGQSRTRRKTTAKDPRENQKKQERRRAKDKARKGTSGANERRGMAIRIERSATAPFLHCCTTTTLRDQGMSSVLVSRQLPSGNVAYAVFLLDAYCLGVKGTFFDIVSRARYDMQIYGKMMRRDQPTECFALKTITNFDYCNNHDRI